MERRAFRIAQNLLRRMRIDRRDPLWKYLSGIERDQGAVLQLTPEGIELFDAAVVDRPGVDYGCIVTAVPRPRERLRAMELLDLVGLADSAEVEARNFAYGDQRRLEIARALATKPKVLCLDEPAAGMNPRESQDLMDFMGQSMGIQPTTADPTVPIPPSETDVPGVFLAGVVAAGYDANKIFIENGREHGPRICSCIGARREEGGGER